MGRIIRLTERDLTRLVRRVIKENDEESYVIDFETGDMVGTYKYGVGFVVNKIGERMGYESHPTSIPDGTKMEKSDHELGMKRKIRNELEKERNYRNELGMDRDDSSNYGLGNIEDDNGNQTSEYTSYGKPSKYDPQYSQDPFERYDHGGSQSGH